MAGEERMQEQEVRLRREALIHMDAGILSCMGEVISVLRKKRSYLVLAKEEKGLRMGCIRKDRQNNHRAREPLGKLL